jgi:hypothetical protein
LLQKSAEGSVSPHRIVRTSPCSIWWWRALGEPVELLLMAQRWFEMADATFGDRRLKALIDDFNQQQMVDPLKN